MNKKIVFLRILFTILLLTTYLIIFMFSSEDGEESSRNSRGTMYAIIDILNGDKEVTNEDIEKYEPLLRKLAHFGIYTVSGVWSMCLMCTFFGKENVEMIGLEKEKSKAKGNKTINKNKSTKQTNEMGNMETKRLTISTFMGFVYACSDEIHQLFSAGRSGKIIDVAIDTMGVLNGALIVLLICTLLVLKERDKVSD